MEFGRVINRSYQLVRRSKVFWRLGLLAALTEGAFNGFGWSNSSGLSSAQGQFSIPVFAQDANNFWTNEGFAQWLDTLAKDQPALLVIGILISAFIVALIWYFSLRSKAGLVLGVVDSEEKKPASSFRELYNRGRPLVWKLFGLYLLVGVIGSALVTGIFKGLIESGSAASFLGLVLAAAVMLYFGFLARISEREIVINNLSIVPALKSAHQLIRERFKQSFLSVIIGVGLDLLFGLTVLSVVILAIGIGALLAVLISTFLPKAAVVAVVALLGLGLIGLIFGLVGFYSAFATSYWTLIFRAFRQSQTDPAQN